MELASLEVAASARLFSILYLSLNVSVHWFAAKAHKLIHCTVKGDQWGVQSRRIVAEIIYNKYHDIQKKTSLLRKSL